MIGLNIRGLPENVNNFNVCVCKKMKEHEQQTTNMTRDLKR